MSYLVIVHVPYTPLVKVNEKEIKGEAEKDIVEKLKDIKGLREDINQITVDSGIESILGLENGADKALNNEHEADSSNTDDPDEPEKAPVIPNNAEQDTESTVEHNDKDKAEVKEDEEETQTESLLEEGKKEEEKDKDNDEVEMRENPECDTEKEGLEDAATMETDTDADKEDPDKTDTVKEDPDKADAVKEDPDNVIERNKSADSFCDDNAPLTPLFDKIPIHIRVENELLKMEVDNVDITTVGHGTFQKFSFVQEDSKKCEQILNQLRGIGVGLKAGTSVSVFPSSIHDSVQSEVEEKLSDADENSPGKNNNHEENQQKESQFKKSVKSRLLVAQVVKSVTANALFTFDYLVLLILASIIACIGLVENSSVVLVASMLISPLMGPILAATFGQVIHKQDLRNLGLKSEAKGLALCLLVGFIFGLISGGVGLNGAIWGSSDSYPTTEMRSRGMLRSLWVGVFIALPSGAAVAISVLGGNAGSLVGVAISASLLPPACNAGMLWAYSILAAIKPPLVESVSLATMATIANSTTSAPYRLLSSNISTFSNMTVTMPTSTYESTTTLLPAERCSPLVDNMYKEVYFCNVSHEAALLGLISLLLTIINIICIFIMAIFVLKIKEVAPTTAGVDTFWRDDVHVARDYYSTFKGESSKSLGKTFLEEYKKIKQDIKEKTAKSKEDNDDDDDNESLSEDMAAIQMHDLLENLQNSPDCLDFLSKLPNLNSQRFAEELAFEYDKAALNLSNKLARRPAVYLSDRPIRDSGYQKVYNTIHNVPSSDKPGLSELRNRFRRKAPSMYIESTGAGIPQFEDGQARESHSSLGLTSGLFKRRKQKVKFQVTKVEEEQELV